MLTIITDQAINKKTRTDTHLIQRSYRRKLFSFDTIDLNKRLIKSEIMATFAKSLNLALFPIEAIRRNMSKVYNIEFVDVIYDSN